MFDRLNELRVANGLKPLKHAPSKAKMAEAIKALTPKGKRATSKIADYARTKGIDPKISRALFRRHYEKPANGWDEIYNDLKKLVDEQAARAAA
jgi:hypothetical protein